MYVTAQRIQDRQGTVAVHSFVHRHDSPDYAFPADARTVPQMAPGRLVWRHTPDVPPGGNAVLAYVDVVVPEGQWSTEWASRLRDLTTQSVFEALPFAARIGPVLVIFNAVDRRGDRGEFGLLLDTALRALDTVSESTHISGG
jgi:hypothetical protein